METAPYYADVADGPEDITCKWLTASDDVRLRAVHWPSGDKGTVLLFPGRTECIEKYGPSALELAARGYGTISIDWRGQGLSDRVGPNPIQGDVADFSDYQLDVAALIAWAEQIKAPKPWYLLCHSMGGAIGLRALHNALPVSAVAFSAPMWGLGMAPYLRPVAWIASFIFSKIGLGHKFPPGTSDQPYLVTNEFDDNELTNDPEMWAFMKRQIMEHHDLQLAGPSMRWLYQALLECRRLRVMPPPNYPVFTALGGNERIVHKPSIHQIMGKWQSGELRVVDGAEHEFPMEIPAVRKLFFDATCDLFSKNT